MALDMDKVESFRKWFTTVITIIVIPVGGLFVSYQRLQIMQEVQDKFINQSRYNADRSGTDLRLDKIDSRIEGLSTKFDAMIQNQVATQEHLKAVESRLK